MDALTKELREIRTQLDDLQLMLETGISRRWIDGNGLKEQLSISDSTFRRLIKNGILKPHTLSGKLFFKIADIEEALEEGKITN